MSGASIATRAMAEIGTPFRLHGRESGVALDCAGLVAVAIGDRHAPIKYRLKGDNRYKIISYMKYRGWLRMVVGTQPDDGDVALCRCSARQLHLMVRANRGWVHSHAGLGKVVFTPGSAPWPVEALFRKANG